jgi:hypothetical protein
MQGRDREIQTTNGIGQAADSLQPADLAEARRYLPLATDDELRAFATRQLNSRMRLTRLVRFYRSYRCRMSRVHLLAACAVTLGRLAGVSETFDKIGELFMPVDAAGEPKGESWRDFVDACKLRRPIQVREELWLAAHMRDLEAVQSQGLDAAFYDEASQNLHQPVWRCAKRHMEVTLGARLRDSSALAGLIPYETAMADSLAVTVGGLVTGGSRLLASYAREAMRALLIPDRGTARDLISYRRTALGLLWHTMTSLSAFRLFREGMRARERGAEATDDAWPLIQSVLGEEASRVDPLIVNFYSNPSRFQVKATIELDTTPARFWSWVATLLVGQGLYETGLTEMDGRFRVFRRADGSMHFIRELYSAGTRRVFDSDFVVRDSRGRPTFFEVFVDLGVDVEMSVRPTGDGGLSIRGANIYWHGIRLPSTALKVEFISRVDNSHDGRQSLLIEGNLLMQPDSRLGRFVIHRLFRRPERLGRIRYLAEPSLRPEGIPLCVRLEIGSPN